MRNYVQPGKVVDVINTAGALTSGDGAQIGTALFGVAVDTYASGATAQLYTDGVFDLAKTTAEAYAAGARLYWNSTTKLVTSATGGMLGIGVCLATAGTAVGTKARVLLRCGLPTLA
jgi:predicted RecA/RadA family phage recombinase